jgi:hypothetical protein
MEVKRENKNLTKIMHFNKPLEAQIETLFVLDIFHNFKAGQKRNISVIGYESVIRQKLQ